MSLEITRGYLRGRLAAALIAFIIALAAGTSFMLYSLEQEKTKVKFGAALGTMAEMTADMLYSSLQLEQSALVYTMAINSNGHDRGRGASVTEHLSKVESAKADFTHRLQRLTHLFHALQWSADGDITIGESERLTADENGDALYEPDKALSSITSYLVGHTMPEAIRPMWEGSGETNLKRDIGLLISLSNRIDVYHDLTGATAARTFRQFNNLADERIKPGLMRTLDRLHTDKIISYRDLQEILLISAALMALFSLLVAGSVLIPMARRVAQAHGQLTEANQEIEIARDRAETSDRAKSEFLANMSHEIRTPMNGVLGMAELLSKTELDTRQKTFTDVIVKSGNALLTIINDILDFSKIDAGQLELDPSPFRIAEAIEDVAALMSARVAEKDLELIVRVDPELPSHVVGDVGRIRQIITNLLGNAVKFTETGHVLIDVSGKPAKGDTKNVELTFSIEDTGVGIPDDKIKSVFEKFAQVDSSSTRRHEGTGLGLAIAARLVELMDSNIQLKSEIGKGTTFWFTASFPVHNHAVAERIPPVDVSGSRILVIDDNPVNREILLEQLSSWNFDCTAADTGADGLQQLAETRAQGLATDCIILDYQMPEMNGEQVAMAVRKEPNLASTPIILLTSVDQADLTRIVNETHLSACLTKPARSSALFDTLISVLQKNRLAQQVDTSIKDDNGPVGVPPSNEPEIGAASDCPGPKPDSMGLDAERAAPAKQGPTSDVETGEDCQIEQQSATQSANRLAAMAERMRKERTDNPPVKPTAETVTAKPETPLKEEKLDVLVAEDNKVNQQVFTEILNETGLRYLIVGNGKRAVSEHAKRKPAIILMDVSMPEMNGLEATRTIRELEMGIPSRHTPIIGVTAHALKGDRERCINAGMDDYVSKPVSSEKLGAVMDRWLNDKTKSLAS